MKFTNQPFRWRQFATEVLFWIVCYEQLKILLEKGVLRLTENKKKTFS